MPSISIKGIGHPSSCLQGQKDPAVTAGSQENPFDAVIFSNLCLFVFNQTVNLLHYYLLHNSVEMTGFEPVTFALQRRCSPAELHPQDLLGLVGLTGFEPVTPALSAQCSNQLSYKPRVAP